VINNLFYVVVIVVFLVLFVVGSAVAVTIPKVLWARYTSAVSWLVSAIVQRLRERDRAVVLLSRFASALRGVVAAWLVYMASFVISDYAVVLTYSHVAWFIGGLVVMYPIGLVLRTCDLAQNLTTSVEEIAPGPVVLFLRSFTTDGVYDDASFLLGIRARSEEEELASVLREMALGEFVSLAKPAVQLQELGPERIEVGARDWQEVVTNLLSRASVVIMRLGTSSSVLWELDAIVRAGKTRRTLFLLPLAASDEELGEQYLRVLYALPDDPAYPRFPVALEDDARAIFFNAHGSSYVIKTRRKWKVNIADSLGLFFEELGVAIPRKGNWKIAGRVRLLLQEIGLAPPRYRQLDIDVALGMLVRFCLASYLVVWFASAVHE
jgi:hypothetical protein